MAFAFWMPSRIYAFSPKIMSTGTTGIKGSTHRFTSTRCAFPHLLGMTDSSKLQIMDSDDREDRLDLPWGDFQSWALRDNLPKYTVDIPSFREGTNGGGSLGITYTLWRSLVRDVTELSGYDATFVRQQQARVLKEEYNLKLEGCKEEIGNETDTAIDDREITLEQVPGILPLLDNFEFHPNGGVSGTVEGLRGIADGTVVVTSSLTQVEKTVRKGYVLTEDGSAAYELGSARTEALNDGMGSYSLDGRTKVNASQVKSALDGSVKFVGEVAEEAATTVVKAAGDEETNRMLVNLGTSTGILLAGATAVNMLSHHLTVNVFWV